MSLAIIIVSWNTRELTLRCLKSIFKSIKNIDFKVYLIDNNSVDGTLGAINNFVTPAFPPAGVAGRLDESELKLGVTNKLNIIANQENMGFARANNQVLALLTGCHSDESQNPEIKKENSWIPDQVGDDKKTEDDILFRPEYILLLNSDTEFIDEKIIPAIEFMKDHEEVGILGPKLLNSDLTLQRSCRQFPKLLDQLLIQLKFYNFWPEKFKAIRQYFMLDFGHHEKREVDQVMGAAMLIKKEVFDKIGLLDEKFWAIFEEVDFCKRAKDAGFQTFFYPEWQIVHHKEQSFGQWKKLRKQINFNRSLYYYFKKHQPFWQLFILWLVQPINLFLTLLDSLVGIRKRVGKSKDL